MKKEVLNYIVEQIDNIKKLRLEEFNKRLIVDITLTNNIISMDITDERIVVTRNDSSKKYLLDFYSTEKQINSIDEFKSYFNNIIAGIKSKTEGITIVYNNEVYLCDIEVESVDNDRGMGTEVVYLISFNANNGEDIKVASLQEYPMGSYSFYDINPDIKFDEEKARKYLQRLSAEYEE